MIIAVEFSEFRHPDRSQPKVPHFAWYGGRSMVSERYAGRGMVWRRFSFFSYEDIQDVHYTQCSLSPNMLLLEW